MDLKYKVEQDENTQVKFYYLTIVLKYSNWVNVLTIRDVHSIINKIYIIPKLTIQNSQIFVFWYSKHILMLMLL